MGRLWSVHAMPLAVALMAICGALNVGSADLGRGRSLASECLTCHGASTGVGTAPNIASLVKHDGVEVLAADVVQGR